MKPRSVRSASGPVAAVRALVDVQFRTILRDLRFALASEMQSGQRVLDLGCGEAPYRSLFCEYGGGSVGLDIPSGFDMKFGSQTALFDGSHLPIRHQSVDWVVATEVLEHVADLEGLLDQTVATIRDGGFLFITTPWSARLHYEPHDYLRPSPNLIERMLTERGLDRVWVRSRGSTASVLFNKLLITFIDNLCKPSWAFIVLPVIAPLMLVTWIVSYVSESLGLSSASDPLGFSFLYRKKSQART